MVATDWKAIRMSDLRQEIISHGYSVGEPKLEGEDEHDGYVVFANKRTVFRLAGVSGRGATKIAALENLRDNVLDREGKNLNETDALAQMRMRTLTGSAHPRQ